MKFYNLYTKEIPSTLNVGICGYNAPDRRSQIANLILTLHILS